MSELFGLTMDKANQLHARYIGRSVIYGSLLIVVSIIFNILGWLMVNQILGILMVLAGIVFLSRPKLIFGFASFGFAKGALSEGTPAGETEKFLKEYWDMAGYVLLAISLAFLFLGTMPVSENPKAVPIILLSLMALGFMLWKWETKFSFGKKFAHFYAFTALVLALLSLIPGSAWIKFTGHDPRVLFVASDRDKAVNDIENTVERMAEKEDVKRLRDIEDALKKGLGVSDKDKPFLEKMRKDRDARSLPALSGKLVSSAVGSIRKEEARYEVVVDWTPFCPNQPRKEFATVPPGDYRWEVKGEYQLSMSKDGRKLYRMVRPGGEILNDDMVWRVRFPKSSAPPLPVRSAPLAAFIYRLGGDEAQNAKKFTVQEETVINIGVNLWEDYANNTVGETPEQNFTENQGELLVKLERKVTL